MNTAAFAWLILQLIVHEAVGNDDFRHHFTAAAVGPVTGRPLSRFAGLFQPRATPVPSPENQRLWASYWAPWSHWSICVQDHEIRVRACNTLRGFRCRGINRQTRPCEAERRAEAARLAALTTTTARPPPTTTPNILNFVLNGEGEPIVDYESFDPWEEDRLIAMEQLFGSTPTPTTTPTPPPPPPLVRSLAQRKAAAALKAVIARAARRGELIQESPPSRFRQVEPSVLRIPSQSPAVRSPPPAPPQAPIVHAFGHVASHTLRDRGSGTSDIGGVQTKTVNVDGQTYLVLVHDANPFSNAPKSQSPVSSPIQSQRVAQPKISSRLPLRNDLARRAQRPLLVPQARPQQPRFFRPPPLTTPAPFFWRPATLAPHRDLIPHPLEAWHLSPATPPPPQLNPLGLTDTSNPAFAARLLGLLRKASAKKTAAKAIAGAKKPALGPPSVPKLQPPPPSRPRQTARVKPFPQAPAIRPPPSSPPLSAPGIRPDASLKLLPTPPPAQPTTTSDPLRLPVDSWSDWSAWSSCECGRRSRTRHCRFLAPIVSLGCPGISYEVGACEDGPACPPATTPPPQPPPVSLPPGAEFGFGEAGAAWKLPHWNPHDPTPAEIAAARRARTPPLIQHPALSVPPMRRAAPKVERFQNLRLLWPINFFNG